MNYSALKISIPIGFIAALICICSAFFVLIFNPEPMLGMVLLEAVVSFSIITSIFHLAGLTHGTYVAMKMLAAGKSLFAVSIVYSAISLAYLYICFGTVATFMKTDLFYTFLFSLIGYPLVVMLGALSVGYLTVFLFSRMKPTENQTS